MLGSLLAEPASKKRVKPVGSLLAKLLHSSCGQAPARRLLLDARAGDVVLCAANMKTKGAHGMDGTAVVTGGAGGIGKRLAIYHNDHGWTLNPASEK